MLLLCIEVTRLALIVSAQQDQPFTTQHTKAAFLYIQRLDMLNCTVDPSFLSSLLHPPAPPFVCRTVHSLCGIDPQSKCHPCIFFLLLLLTCTTNTIGSPVTVQCSLLKSMGLFQEANGFT